MTPAQWWRRTVRTGMSEVRGDDEELRSYLEQALPGEPGLERFVLAVAMLTFGVLDCRGLDIPVAIVDNLPPERHPARMLARALDDLLPTGGHVLASPDDTLRWLTRHRAELAWDEANGVFGLG